MSVTRGHQYYGGEYTGLIGAVEMVDGDAQTHA